MKKSLIINRLKLSDFVFSLTLVLELKDLLSSGRQIKVSGKFYGTNMKLGKERKKGLEKYRKNYGFSQSFLLGFFLGLFSKIFRAIAAITISLLGHLNPCSCTALKIKFPLRISSFFLQCWWNNFKEFT